MAARCNARAELSTETVLQLFTETEVRFSASETMRLKLFFFSDRTIGSVNSVGFSRARLLFAVRVPSLWGALLLLLVFRLFFFLFSRQVPTGALQLFFLLFTFRSFFIPSFFCYICPLFPFFFFLVSFFIVGRCDSPPNQRTNETSTSSTRCARGETTRRGSAGSCRVSRGGLGTG